MNDNDIIRALECCVSGDCTKSQVEVCKPCPYFHDGNCTDLLKSNALDLINRLQAENERLNSLATAKDVIIEDIQKRYNACLEEKSEIVQGMSCTINKAKSEARKEFAERLISEKEQDWDDNWGLTQIVTVEGIEDLLEEMEKEND